MNRPVTPEELERLKKIAAFFAKSDAKWAGNIDDQGRISVECLNLDACGELTTKEGES